MGPCRCIPPISYWLITANVAWRSERNTVTNLLPGDYPGVTAEAWAQSSPSSNQPGGLPFRYPISNEQQRESSDWQRYKKEVKRLRGKLASMKAKLTGLKQADMVDSFRGDDIIRFGKTVSESSPNLATKDYRPDRNPKPFHKHMQTVPYNGQQIVEKSLRALNTQTNIAQAPSRKKKVQFMDPEYAKDFLDNDPQHLSRGSHSSGNDHEKLGPSIHYNSSGSHTTQVRKFVVQLLAETDSKARLANRFLRQATEALTLVILVTLTVALFTLISDTLVFVRSPLADYHYIEKTKDLVVAAVHIVVYCWPPRGYHRQVRMLSDSSLALAPGEGWGMGELVAEVGERHGPLSVWGFFTLAPHVIATVIGFCLIFSITFIQPRQI